MRIMLLLVLTIFSSNSNTFEFKFDINNYHGQVVYLDFWASWCVPCRKSFPWMNEMHVKYQDKGLKIIAVNLDEDKNNAATFLDKYSADFQIAYDNGELAEKYEVKGMPFSVLFDRDGKVINTHIGFKLKETKKYEKTIVVALGEKNEEN